MCVLLYLIPVGLYKGVTQRLWQPPRADPGGWRGAQQSRSQVRDCQEILAKGLWTATGTAAAADEDWKEEEVPSKGFAFAGGCEAEMEFGLGVVLISQGVLLPTWRHKLDVFWDENWRKQAQNLQSLLSFLKLYSFYFCPSISSLPPCFPPSLHHFDLVVRASLSLLSGPQFLAGLLKCDFLHPVFKKGYWALQVSCCFSSVSTSLLCFPSCFSVSFVCASLHWSNLPCSLWQVLPHL